MTLCVCVTSKKDKRILKRLHLAGENGGESLAQEDAFNAVVKAALPTKEDQLAKSLVVLEKSWIHGGFQYQTGPLVGSGDLNAWMIKKTKSPDGTLRHSKAHLFDLRRLLGDYSTNIKWLSKRFWSHRDYHPTNALVELSLDGHHLKRTEIMVVGLFYNVRHVYYCSSFCVLTYH